MAVLLLAFSFAFAQEVLPDPAPSPAEVEQDLLETLEQMDSLEAKLDELLERQDAAEAEAEAEEEEEEPLREVGPECLDCGESDTGLEKVPQEGATLDE